MAKARAVLAEVQYVVGLPPRITSIATATMYAGGVHSISITTFPPPPFRLPDPGLYDEPPSKPA